MHTLLSSGTLDALAHAALSQTAPAGAAPVMPAGTGFSVIFWVVLAIAGVVVYARRPKA